MAEVITLAKMGNTSHLHHQGGRPNKYAKKEKVKEGFFNVNDYSCWVVGICENDLKTECFNHSVRNYHIPKGSRSKRYF